MIPLSIILIGDLEPSYLQLGMGINGERTKVVSFYQTPSTQDEKAVSRQKKLPLSPVVLHTRPRCHRKVAKIATVPWTLSISCFTYLTFRHQSHLPRPNYPSQYGSSKLFNFVHRHHWSLGIYTWSFEGSWESIHMKIALHPDPHDSLLYNGPCHGITTSILKRT